MNKKYIEIYKDNNNRPRKKYICPCGQSRTRLESFLDHCKQCLDYEEDVSRQKFLKQMDGPRCTNQFQQRLKRVESILGQFSQSNTNLIKDQKQIDLFTNLIMDPISTSVINHFKSKIRIIVQQCLLKPMNIKQSISVIQQNIMELVVNIKFNDIVNQYQNTLDQFHKQLINSRKQLSEKTKYRDNFGYQFWKQFQRVNQLNIILVRNKIIQLSSHEAVDNVLSYYSKMQKSCLFNKLPPIPRSINKKSIMKKHIPKIKVSNIRQSVYKLLLKCEYQMATDLWFIACLGLRSSQIKQAYLMNDSSIYFDVIEFFQRKNKFRTLRIIPSSLKILVSHYHVQFPITEKRFIRVRNYCIQQYQRFYSIRSACLSQIFHALYNASQLNRFHTRANTSISHYINFQVKDFINQAFHLDEFTKKISTKVDDSGIMLVKNNNIWRQQKYLQEDLKFDFIQPLDFVDEERQDCVIQGHQTIQQNQVEDSQKTQVQMQLNLAQQGIIMNNQKFDSLTQTFNILFGNSKWKELIQQYLLMNKIAFTNEKQKQQATIKAVEQIFEVIVKLIKFKDGQLLNSSQSSTTMEDENSDVYCVFEVEENDQKTYRCNDSKITKETSLKRQLRARIRQKTSNPQIEFYLKSKPKCPLDGEDVLIQSCEDHFYFYCKNHELKHFCIKQRENGLIFRDKPTIATQSQSQIILELVDLPRMKRQNNIRDVLKTQQYEFISDYKYLENVPSNIITKFNYVSHQNQKLLQKNANEEIFLPLTISKCQQLQKGYGVFATLGMKKNTLVCNYFGLIGTNQSPIQSSNGLFSLGFLQSNDTVTELLIIPDKYTNIGRFLNASEKPNCKACIFLKSSMEVIVFLITIRDVSIGEQLTWNYGKRFWVNDQEKIKKQVPLKIQKEVNIKETKSLVLKSQNNIREISHRKMQSQLNLSSKDQLIIIAENRSLTMKINKIRLIKYLITRYPNQKFLNSLISINKKFSYYVPILGDGNCAVRALGIGLMLIKKFGSFTDFFMEKGSLSPLTGTNLSEEKLQLLPDFLVYYWNEMILPMKDLQIGERFIHIYEWYIKSDILDSILVTYFRSLCYNLAKHDGSITQDRLTAIGTYGEHMEIKELVMIADLYKVRLKVVWAKEFCQYFFCESDDTFEEQVILLFRSGHYELIIKDKDIHSSLKRQAMQNYQVLMKNKDFVPFTNEIQQNAYLSPQKTQKICKKRSKKLNKHLKNKPKQKKLIIKKTVKKEKVIQKKKPKVMKKKKIQKK